MFDAIFCLSVTRKKPSYRDNVTISHSLFDYIHAYMKYNNPPPPSGLFTSASTYVATDKSKTDDVVSMDLFMLFSQI